MCWIHSWRYDASQLRTCKKCGVHQEYGIPLYEMAYRWYPLGCKSYADAMQEHKDNLDYEDKIKKYNENERKVCPYHNDMTIPPPRNWPTYVKKSAVDNPITKSKCPGNRK